MSVPLITIFVRHSSDCPYKDEEFSKRCNCRKHFRWTQNGKQYRRKAGTRSWVQAEEEKRRLEDQLAGRIARPDPSGKLLAEARDSFIAAKEIESRDKANVYRHKKVTADLQRFLASKGVHIVQGITRDLLIEYMSTWKKLYPSSNTRALQRARLRTFLRYCFQSKWLDRIPDMPVVNQDEDPTQPLTDAEYQALLDAIAIVVTNAEEARKVHALILLMRHSGLAIGDALKLERSAINFSGTLYRVMTARQKTGENVYVPLPPNVAQEVLAVANGNPRYLFWDGKTEKNTPRTTWNRKYIRPIFEKAGIADDGWMTSHRLRDTFAVDLLQKGVPMEEVSKMLGHASIRTTERHYAKWAKGRQDRLDALVSATWK